MRVVNQNEMTAPVASVESYLNSSESPVSQTSYHELAEKPVHAMDALAQLHSNLELLTDLSARLAFQMREVRYLLKA